MNQLKKNNQIVFSYENKINGSVSQIAGVCNSDGNVVGMMPHPERATEKVINHIDHKPSSLIFESLIETAGYEKLSFQEHEKQHIEKNIKRKLTDTELQILAAEWSEHCSYKSSKKHLKMLPTTGLM